MPDSTRSRFESTEDVASTEYRALSGLAIGGLFLGLLSVVALLHPSLCVIALLTLVVNVLALRKIAEAPGVLTGKKVALLGMTLAVVFGAAGPAHWYTSRWFARREVRQFSLSWFEALARNEPHVAEQAGWVPDQRWPVDKELITRYMDDIEKLEQLESFTESPDIRALLALGEDADVRYYRTDSQERLNGSDLVTQTFAITYPQTGVKKTIFVSLKAMRWFPENASRSQWRITSHVGGARPPTDDAS